jgi:hypothetical protein
MRCRALVDFQPRPATMSLEGSAQSEAARRCSMNSLPSARKNLLEALVPGHFATPRRPATRFLKAHLARGPVVPGFVFSAAKVCNRPA